MLGKRILLAVTLWLFAASAAAFGAGDGEPLDEFAIVVNADAPVDSISDVDLLEALRGRHATFGFIGLQKQNYRELVNQLAASRTDLFEQGWWQLFLAKKRKRTPVVSENAEVLIRLAENVANALMVVRLDDTGLNVSGKRVKLLKLYHRESGQRLRAVVEKR